MKTRRSHPCVSGEKGQPCGRVQPSSRYDSSQCRLCWLYYHDPDYRRLWRDKRRCIDTNKPRIAKGKKFG